MIDRAELARHLDALKSRTDDGVLVLADWLQQQGHPWGELIALQHNAARDPALWPAADSYLDAHWPAIFGMLAGIDHSSFEWERGFLRRAVVGTQPEISAMVRAVECLLAEPIATLIDTVVLNPYVAKFELWRDWGSSLKHVVDPWAELGVLAAAIPSNITRIGLGGWPAPAAAGYVAMPSFRRVTAVLGNRLTALELTGWAKDKLGALVLPNVTDLAIRFARADEACLQALGRSELPKLERLTVWLGGWSSVTVDDVHAPLERSEMKGGSRYPATFSVNDLEEMDPYKRGIDYSAYSHDLQIMFEAAWARGITHLEIGSPCWRTELIDVLGSPEFHRLLPALESLTISGGTLEESYIANLKRAPIAHLDLRIASVVARAAAPTLAAEFPGIALRTDGDVEDFHFRYVATVE